MTAPPLVTSPGRPGAAAPLGRVARGGALNLAGAIANVVIGIGVTWLAVRALPPAPAGALFTAIATFALVANVAKLGTQTGLVYWIARLRALGQGQLASRCVRIGVLPVIAASLLSAALLWWGVPLLTGLADEAHADEFARALRALALVLPLAALSDALLAATRGFRAMRPTVTIDRLVRPGLQLAGFALLALLVVAYHRDIDLAVFALAWVVPYAPAAALAALALRRVQRNDGLRPQGPEAPASEGERPLALWRNFWTFTWPRAVANVVQTALQRVDVLLVAGLAGLRAAAIYAVACRFVLAGQFANQAIAQSVQPRLAEVLTVGDRGAARLLYRSGTAWLVLLAWPLYLLVAVFAPVYLGAFGSRYVVGVPVVVILAAAMMVAAACGMVDMVLAMAGRTTWNLVNVSVALAVMVAVDLVAIPRMGTVGAAIGLAAAMLTNNLVPLVQIFSLLRLHPLGVGTLTACGLALLCFGAIPVAAVAVAGVGPATVAVSLAVGGGAYAVGCWRFRRVLRLTAFLAMRTPRSRRAPSGDGRAEGDTVSTGKVDYTAVFRDDTAVEKYDSVVFAPDSYATAVNRRQRAYLRELVKIAFPERRPIQYDFACGTGRAIKLLHGLVRGAHGYDTSAAMLAKARDAGVFADLHEIPESGALPAPANTGAPALVTVFRLLLNVPEEVRDRAIAFAASVLPHWGSGLLVVENHGNRSSVRHLRHRRRAGDPWFNELSHDQVARLLARHGFTVVARRGFAVCPPGAYAVPWLRPLAYQLDGLAWRVPAAARIATNVLYVARRTAEPA